MLKPTASINRLALALGLAMAAGSGHASTLTANDVFLNAWESATGSSYNADLGISVPTFLADAQAGDSLTLSLGASFQSWVNAALAANGYVEFNIAGVNVTSSYKDTNDSLLVSGPGIGGFFAPGINFGQFSQDQTKISNRVEEINVTGTGLVPSDSSSQNESSFNAISAPWGAGAGMSTSVSASTQLGQGGVNDLYIEYLASPGGTIHNSTPVSEGVLAGNFSISSDNSGVVWTSNAATAVPIPAGAEWMFLGSLLGLMKMKSRKS